MAWKLENIRKDPISKEMYADLFISQITEEPKTACLFTIGDARAVEIILEKYKNTQFVVFDYPALIKFLEFAKPANLLKAVPLKYDWESEDVFLKFVEGLQNYNINNMSFDLIIANPPYDYGSDILETVKKHAKASVFLMPAAKYDKHKLYSFVEIFETVPYNPFNDASVDRLCITKVLPNPVNMFRSSRDFKLANTKHKKLWKFIDTVPGVKRDSVWRSGSEMTILNSLAILLPSRGLYSKSQSTDCYRFNRLQQKNDTVWQLRKNNERARVEGENSNCTNLCVIVAKTEKARLNFLDFVESDYFVEIATDYTQLLSGFPYDKFLTLIEQSSHEIDWSHAWTDAEILKELGLPEDFLKENV